MGVIDFKGRLKIREKLFFFFFHFVGDNNRSLRLDVYTFYIFFIVLSSNRQPVNICAQAHSLLYGYLFYIFISFETLRSMAE